MKFKYKGFEIICSLRVFLYAVFTKQGRENLKHYIKEFKGE